MLGVLLGFMLVPAATSHADTTDADFATYLANHDIHLGTASQTLRMAHATCQDLDAGYTQKDEILQLTAARQLSQAQAQEFVGAATADYCPSKHPDSPPAGG
jgi:hypothetical protein